MVAYLPIFHHVYTFMCVVLWLLILCIPFVLFCCIESQISAWFLQICHHKPLVTDANLYADRNVYQYIKTFHEVQLKDMFYVYNVINVVWSLFLVEFMLRKNCLVGNPALSATWKLCHLVIINF
jgi:hypothetical protein